MTHGSTSRSRARFGRGFGRLLAPVAVAGLLLAATGCSSSHHDSAQATIAKLGKVPIPSAPASPIVPTAAPGHAQLVAMGDPVQVDLGNQQARITATGPDLANAAPAQGAKPADSSPGTVTVTLSVPAGSLPLTADTLTADDELGHPIPLTADTQAATAAPGHDAVVHLSGTFGVGHATLTWSSAGKPLATWDFEVELD
ncbi:hypothetical protein [Kitasatospora sp. LaBMicrA B282]|uniref:hypothetical protein n=1 Tax=Kitasatospora sp. LaBMicrA B282 TaxID=3420949 RepID=UPI003D141B2A